MKKLSDITNTNELQRIWDKNSKLQDKVESWYIDDIYDYITECLDCLPSNSIDYEYGYGGHNYVNCKDGYEEDFLNGVKEMQKMYGFLPDSVNSVVDKALNIYKNYDYEDDAMSYELSVYINDIEDSFITTINEMLNNISWHDIEDYFYDILGGFDYLYVDDNGILYEFVSWE